MRIKVTIRRLALVALAGQLLWLFFVAFGGLWEPGYSEIRDAVSFLGARDAASPWVFDTGGAVSGLSLIALAGALALDAPRSLRGRLGLLLRRCRPSMAWLSALLWLQPFVWIGALAMALLDLYGHQRL